MKQSYISTNRSAKLQTICSRCNWGKPGYNSGTRVKFPFSVHFAVFRLFSPVPALYVHLLSVSAVKILSAVSALTIWLSVPWKTILAAVRSLYMYAPGLSSVNN